jgi:hypothetical protein
MTPVATVLDTLEKKKISGSVGIVSKYYINLINPMRATASLWNQGKVEFFVTR